MLNAKYLFDLISPFENQIISDTWALSSCCFNTTNSPLVEEDFNSCNVYLVSLDLVNEGANTSYFKKIRQELYSLSVLNSFKFCDLGNILPNKSIQERIFAYTELHNELLDNNKKLVIISNSDSFANLHFQIYANRKVKVNLVNIDSKIKIFENPHSAQSGLLGKVLEKNKIWIRNLTLIGTQEYYVQEQEKEILNRNYYTEIRLGKLKNNIEEIEPFIRAADLVNYNLSAIENNVFLARTDNSPNGLSSMEACIIGGYMGASDNCKSFALYGYYEQKDKTNQSAALIAQVLWYLVKTNSLQIKENPKEGDMNFTRYIVNYHRTDLSIAFYKSKLSNRWWVEFKQGKDKTYLFPCSQGQYKMMINNDIPEQWIEYIREIDQS